MARPSLPKRTLYTLPLLLAGTLAHIQMEIPSPLRDPHSNRSAEPKDYNILAPLHADGSDFACKLYQYNTPLVSVATYEAGQTYPLKLRGGATHGGGSCQVSLSCDYEHFKVIKSMEGNCPTQTEWEFTIPEDVGSGEKCLLAWTWFNKVGNREMYMNCAVVDLVGASASSRTKAGSAASTGKLHSNARAQAVLARYPDMFVANLKGVNDCMTKETEDVVFDDPGHDVVSGDGMKASTRVRRRKEVCSGVGRTSAPSKSAAWSASGSSSQSGGSSAGDDGQWHPDGVGSSSSSETSSGGDDALYHGSHAHSSMESSDNMEDSESDSSNSLSFSSKEPNSEVEQELQDYLATLSDDDSSANTSREEESSVPIKNKIASQANDVSIPGACEFFEQDSELASEDSPSYRYGFDRGSDDPFRNQLATRAPLADEEPTGVPDAESSGFGDGEDYVWVYDDRDDSSSVPSEGPADTSADELPAYIKDYVEDLDTPAADENIPESDNYDDDTYARLKQSKKHKHKRPNHTKTRKHHKTSALPPFPIVTPEFSSSPSPSYPDITPSAIFPTPANSSNSSSYAIPSPTPFTEPPVATDVPAPQGECPPGAFLCTSPTQFWVCGQFSGLGWSYGALRDVSAGMNCVDGVISAPAARHKRRSKRGFGWWIGTSESEAMDEDASPLDHVIKKLDKLLEGVGELGEEGNEGVWKELKRGLEWLISSASESNDVPENPLEVIPGKAQALGEMLDSTLASLSSEAKPRRRSTGWWLTFGGSDSVSGEADPLVDITNKINELSPKFGKLEELCSGIKKTKRGWGFFGAFGEDNIHQEVHKVTLGDPFAPIADKLQQYCDIVDELLGVNDEESGDEGYSHEHGHGYDADDVYDHGKYDHGYDHGYSGGHGWGYGQGQGQGQGYGYSPRHWRPKYPWDKQGDTEWDKRQVDGFAGDGVDAEPDVLVAEPEIVETEPDVLVDEPDVDAADADAYAYGDTGDDYGDEYVIVDYDGAEEVAGDAAAEDHAIEDGVFDDYVNVYPDEYLDEVGPLERRQRVEDTETATSPSGYTGDDGDGIDSGADAAEAMFGIEIMPSTEDAMHAPSEAGDGTDVDAEALFGAVPLDATPQDDTPSHSTPQIDAPTTDTTQDMSSDPNTVADDTLDVFANFPLADEPADHKRQDYDDNVEVPGFWYSEGDDGGNGIDGVAEAVEEMFGDLEEEGKGDGVLESDDDDDEEEEEEEEDDDDDDDYEEDGEDEDKEEEEEKPDDAVPEEGDEEGEEPENAAIKDGNDGDEYEDEDGWVWVYEEDSKGEGEVDADAEEGEDWDEEEEVAEPEEALSNSTSAIKLRKLLRTRQEKPVPKPASKPVSKPASKPAPKPAPKAASKPVPTPPGFKFSDGSNGGDGIDAEPIAVFGSKELADYEQKLGFSPQTQNEEKPAQKPAQKPAPTVSKREIPTPPMQEPAPSPTKKKDSERPSDDQIHETEPATPSSGVLSFSDNVSNGGVGLVEVAPEVYGIESPKNYEWGDEKKPKNRGKDAHKAHDASIAAPDMLVQNVPTPVPDVSQEAPVQQASVLYSQVPASEPLVSADPAPPGFTFSDGFDGGDGVDGDLVAVFGCEEPENYDEKWGVDEKAAEGTGAEPPLEADADAAPAQAAPETPEAEQALAPEPPVAKEARQAAPEEAETEAQRMELRPPFGKSTIPMTVCPHYIINSSPVPSGIISVIKATPPGWPYLNPRPTLPAFNPYVSPSYSGPVKSKIKPQPDYVKGEPVAPSVEPVVQGTVSDARTPSLQPMLPHVKGKTKPAPGFWNLPNHFPLDLANALPNAGDPPAAAPEAESITGPIGKRTKPFGKVSGIWDLLHHSREPKVPIKPTGLDVTGDPSILNKTGGHSGGVFNSKGKGKGPVKKPGVGTHHWPGLLFPGLKPWWAVWGKHDNKPKPTPAVNPTERYEGEDPVEESYGEDDYDYEYENGIETTTVTVFVTPTPLIPQPIYVSPPAFNIKLPTVNITANVMTAPVEPVSDLPTPPPAPWVDGIPALGCGPKPTPTPSPSTTTPAVNIAASILPYFFGPGPIVLPGTTFKWPGPWHLPLRPTAVSSVSTIPSAFQASASSFSVPLSTYAAAVSQSVSWLPAPPPGVLKAGYGPSGGVPTPVVVPQQPYARAPVSYPPAPPPGVPDAGYGPSISIPIVAPQQSYAQLSVSYLPDPPPGMPNAGYGPNKPTPVVVPQQPYAQPSVSYPPAPPPGIPNAGYGPNEPTPIAIPQLPYAQTSLSFPPHIPALNYVPSPVATPSTLQTSVGSSPAAPSASKVIVPQVPYADAPVSWSTPVPGVVPQTGYVKRGMRRVERGGMGKEIRAQRGAVLK